MGYVPTVICRRCKRILNFSTEGWAWQDNLGWYVCPSTERQHYPVEPVEGIDY